MMIFFTIWIFTGGLVTLVLTLNLGPRTGITTENGTGSVWHFYTSAFRNKFQDQTEFDCQKTKTVNINLDIWNKVIKAISEILSNWGVERRYTNKEFFPPRSIGVPVGDILVNFVYIVIQIIYILYIVNVQ